MKKISLIIILFYFGNFSAQYYITYDKITRDNSTSLSSIISKTYLYIYNDKSKFVSDKVFDESFNDLITNSDKEIEELQKSKSQNIKGDSLGNIIIIDFQKDSIDSRQFFSNKYYQISQKNINFNWKITNESKKIAGFNCIKAICEYNQREFIAWFTKEIPISDGPWKFNGLPGLIIEISTKDESITYSLTGLKKRDNKNEKFIFPYSKTMTVDEYRDQTFKEYQNQFKYMKSKNPNSNSIIEINNFNFPKMVFQ